jgi:hypothetical protein
MTNESAAVGRGVHFLKRVEIPDYAEPEKTYLRRWIIFACEWFRIYVHHIVLPDDPSRGYHDHPWPFISIRLWRNYREYRLHRLRGGAGFFLASITRNRFISFRRATDLHQVVPEDERGCWTLVLGGPRCRVWGFQKPEYGAPWVPHQDQVVDYRVKRGL